MTDDDARRMAEEWLSLLSQALPRSSWLSPIRALLEGLPRAFVEAGGSFDELSKADLWGLTSFVPQLGTLMRQYQNVATPVFRLPQEVMEIIFLTLRDSCRPHWTDRHSRSIDWMRACTHVCHRWRAIAVQLPRLWISLDVSHVSLNTLLTMVDRTQGHCCDMFMSRPSVGFELAHVLIRVAARVNGLGLTGISSLELHIGSLTAIVPFLSSAQLPFLESLKITAPERRVPIYRFPRPARLTVLLPMCSFPVLRNLVLKNCTIFSRDELLNAQETLFPQLETLVIDCIGVDQSWLSSQPRPFQNGANRPSVFELLSVTPRLRQLTLLEPFPALLRVPEAEAVTFPASLERVSLTMRQDRRKMKYTAFVRSLHLESAPGIELDLRIVRPVGDGSWQRCYRENTGRLRSFCEFHGTERPPVHLTLTFAPATTSRGNPNSRRDTHIQILSKPKRGHVPSTHFTLEDHSGNAMFKGVPLEWLESLTLDVTHHAHLQVTPAWWQKHFASAKNVREIRVVGGYESAFALVRALSVEMTSEDDEGTGEAESAGDIANQSEAANEGDADPATGQGHVLAVDNVAVGLREVLFPSLQRLSIQDKHCEDAQLPTLGWRCARALDKMATFRSRVEGVESLSTLSLPARFAERSWVKHLRGIVGEMRFE